MRKLLLVVAVVVGLVVAAYAEQSTTFLKGSNKSLVLVLQGKPDTITKHHTYEMWHYDYNSVTISLKNGKVIKWHNTNGRLKVPKEKRVEKKTVTKNQRGKRKDDREVKSIPLGVIGVSSAHTRDNAPPMDYELYCPVPYYSGWVEPAYNNYREPAYDYYALPSYNNRRAPTDNGFKAPAYNDCGGGGGDLNYRAAYDAAQRGLSVRSDNQKMEESAPFLIMGDYDNQGNHYTPFGGGNLLRSDGTIMQKSAGGYVNTKTGRFTPSTR